MSGRRPSLERERALWREGRMVVAGIDEVGRGPLAGPVVAAAVVFYPGQRPIRGLNDSKVLTAKARDRLALEIRSRARAIGIGAASVHEIDRWNIRRATALAMRRAVTRLQRALGAADCLLLLDGLPLPEIGYPHQALVDGDAHCVSIAAAGIVAKTLRDRLMARLAARHPGYGWETNAGYGTAEHLAALRARGPTRHHRVSFAPVAQLGL